MYSTSHLRPITKLSAQNYQPRKRVPRASIGDKIKLNIIVAMGFTTIRGCLLPIFLARRAIWAIRLVQGVPGVWHGLKSYFVQASQAATSYFVCPFGERKLLNWEYQVEMVIRGSEYYTGWGPRGGGSGVQTHNSTYKCAVTTYRSYKVRKSARSCILLLWGCEDREYNL